MAQSPHLLITLIDQGQDTPEVPANEGTVRLDKSFNQQLQIDVTARVDGSRNVTLTSDEFRDNFSYILTNGDGADFNLILPDGQRQFLVQNETLDQVTVQSTSAPDSVIIPSDELALMRQNGTFSVSTIARSSLNGNPYDFVFSGMGQIVDNQVLAQWDVARNITLATDLVGSRASAGVIPSSNVTINIRKNGASFNTLTISSVDGSGSFGTSTEQTFAPGDILGIVVNGAANGMENIRITLKGAR